MPPSPRRSRSRPAPPEPLRSLGRRLTPSQRDQLERWQGELAEAGGWRGDLPVAVLEPCWLRLRRIPVERLAAQLPPDGSEAAPELVRYRQHRQAGEDDWNAQLLCWQEFGCAAFQEAQRRFWDRQERGHHGWTLGRYLALLAEYRQGLEPGGLRRLPLLQLARPHSDERHQLFWLTRCGPIGHTCL